MANSHWLQKASSSPSLIHSIFQVYLEPQTPLNSHTVNLLILFLRQRRHQHQLTPIKSGLHSRSNTKMQVTTLPDDDSMLPNDTIPPKDTIHPNDTTLPDGTIHPNDTTLPDGTIHPNDTTLPGDTIHPNDTILPNDTMLDNDSTLENNTTPSDDTIVPQVASPPERTPLPKQPVVIGIYGISGCGKTFLLNNIKDYCGPGQFNFYDGSQVIAAVTDGGLKAFQAMPEQDKMHHRELAISQIQATAANTGKAAIVAGHLMFWPENEEDATAVYTEKDMETYTHIIYLDTPAKVIAQRRLNDKKRARDAASVSHLEKWQHCEKESLRKLCRDRGILFLPISSEVTSVVKIVTLLHDFSYHDEQHNLEQALSLLDEAVANTKQSRNYLHTMLVLDGDKTLAAEDTGELFWANLVRSGQLKDDQNPLKTLFSSSLGYSYKAFRQATMLYEEACDDQQFDTWCKDVASAVTMHPEFFSLLCQVVKKGSGAGAIIVTCGLRRVWEHVLNNEGLSSSVKVIGGGRIADGLVVTPSVKAAIVERLQKVHHIYVWAMGDSPLDIDMLKKADKSIVVVGDEQTRSKTMDTVLMKAIESGELNAHQALLPHNESPRLNEAMLPIVDLTEPELADSIFLRNVMHTTDKPAAKLLSTSMRDATRAGRALQEAHRCAGWYLATECFSAMLGVEEFSMQHVQGNTTKGFRVANEIQTLIIALMRGGEPMAFGVHDAMPLAMFMHAKLVADVKPQHLEGQRTIILVDSVVNSGKSVVEFVEHIRELASDVRVVVVADVVHIDAIRTGVFANMLRNDGKLALIALRLSDNKYTGTKGIDTGNRLFNTTHLE